MSRAELSFELEEAGCVIVPMTEHDLLEVVEIEETTGLSQWGWEAYRAELEKQEAVMLVARRHFADARETEVDGTGVRSFLPREPGGQRGHYCGGFVGAVAVTAAGCRMSSRNRPPSFSRMSRRSMIRSSAP